MVSKSFNSGIYGGYTQYYYINTFWSIKADVYGSLVEVVINSSCIVKDTRAWILYKSPNRSEWFETLSLRCLKIMGQFNKVTLALIVPVFLYALSELKEWDQVQEGWKTYNT